MALNKGFVALLDVTDIPWVAGRTWSVKWSRGQKPYARAAGKRAPGKPFFTQRMHRVLATEWQGHIDHINGDTLDNRRQNLRPCTAAENARNRGAQRSSTGYKGIYRQRGKYQAAIEFEGRRTYLGTFATPEAAARAYDEAARKLHGEFARTNAMLGLLPEEAA